jgi:hypothetical protein
MHTHKNYQTVNTLDSANPTVSVTAIPASHCSVKAAIDDMQMSEHGQFK